jgi:hypothetical protein
MSRKWPEIRLYRRDAQPLPLRLPMVGPTGDPDNMGRLERLLGMAGRNGRPAYRHR